MLSKNITLSKQRDFWARYKIKIASVLFAILIWFLIVTGGAFHYTCVFPIRLPTHSDYAIINELPKEIRVKVMGKGVNLITTLLFNEGIYEPDVKWEEGQYSLPVSEKNIILSGDSKNLTINQIVNPDSINIIVEKVITKKVPISSQYLLKTSPGYIIVGTPFLSPDSITIKGPKSYILPIDSIQTKKHTFNELKRPMSEYIDLAIDNQKMISFSRKDVQIIAVVQKILEKEISNIPVSAQNVPYNMRPIVLPARISLTVQGGVEIISPLTADSFYVYLNYLEPTAENEHSFSPEVKPIPEVRVSQYKPERFKIVLEKD